nr:MAG TPA: hypothetical protein [Caudoviricetes sp.]
MRECMQRREKEVNLTSLRQIRHIFRLNLR